MVVVAVHKYYVCGMKKVVQLSIGDEKNKKKTCDLIKCARKGTLKDSTCVERCGSPKPL